MTNVSVGVDIGSTRTKITVVTPTGTVLRSIAFDSQWFSGVTGLEAVAHLVHEIRTVLDSVPDSQLTAIGVASVAESGILVSEDGRDLTSVVPWYDPRGKEIIDPLSAEFIDDFSAATGLEMSSQWSFVKLGWFASQGVRLEGRWLSIAEYVAYRLTGNQFAEPSLLSRTGMIEQDGLRPYLPVLALIGANSALIPPLKSAGEAWGRVVRSPLRDAIVTVAGHDHSVAAFAAGATEPEDMFNSVGTADALVRVLEGPLSRSDRLALTRAGWSHGAFVTPGRRVLLGGTRGGLVLGQIRATLGEIPGAVDTTSDQSNVVVRGADLRDTDVTITLTGATSPHEVWRAAVEHTNTKLAEAYEQITVRVGPARRIIAAGGWLDVDSVWRARKKLFPGLQRAQQHEAGAFGAALFAQKAAQAEN